MEEDPHKEVISGTIFCAIILIVMVIDCCLERLYPDNLTYQFSRMPNPPEETLEEIDDSP